MSGGVMQAAGPVAQSIAELGWLLFAGGAAILAGVLLLLGLALRKDNGAIRPMRWIVGGGLVFPAVVLAALFAWTLPLTPAREAPPADALLVTVTGRMWWWEVRYPAGPGQQEIVTANELRIPVGRSVAIALASDDVIHSFWVPALAGKVDMVPGRRHQLVLTAGQPGVYRGQCAEFCGEQHARMALHVVAQTPAAFEGWRQAQTGPAPAPADPSRQRGMRTFLDQHCDACHTVRGVTAQDSRLGPDLTHVAGRLHLGAGTLANSPGALADWVAHVQRIKPGARMPSFEGRLEGQTLAELADWLGSLR